MKRITMILCILLCICWGGIIIFNGAESGEVSQSKSVKITTLIKNTGIVDKNPLIDKSYLKKIGIKNMNAVVRKIGHFSEYFILAICLSLLINKFKNNTINKIINVLFLCLLIAVVDEFIQKYTPNRTSSVMDILIDFTGSIFGTCFFYFIYIVKRKIIKS